MSNKLTDKQEKFCNEYLIDLNATQAAIRSGYSEKTAKDIACQNLAKLNIAERIAELKSKILEKTEITQQDVINNLMRGMKIALGEDPTHVLASSSGVPIELAIKKTDLAAFVKIQDMFMKHTGGYETDNSQKDSGVVQNIIISDEMVKKLSDQIEGEC